MENLNSFENNNYYLLIENSGFNFNNNNFSLKLAELSVFSEFFLGFLGLSVLVYTSLTAYNKRYKNVLLQFAAFSISVLIISLMLLIIFNDRLTTMECISLDFSFLNNSFGESAKIATGLIVLAVLYVTEEYILKNNINNTEYTIIILCAVLGLIIVINANDFALIFLGLELQSIALYILSGIKKNSVFSLESGLKYFILGSLSAGYFLFGWSLLYGITGLSMLVNFHFFFFNLFLYINGKISLESKNLLEISYGTKNQTSSNYLEFKQIKIIFLLTIKEFLLTIKTKSTVQIGIISSFSLIPDDQKSVLRYDFFDKEKFMEPLLPQGGYYTILHIARGVRAERYAYINPNMHLLFEEDCKTILELGRECGLDFDLEDRVFFGTLKKKPFLQTLIHNFRMNYDTVYQENDRIRRHALAKKGMLVRSNFAYLAGLRYAEGRYERADFYAAVARTTMYLLRTFGDDPLVQEYYRIHNYNCFEPDSDIKEYVHRVTMNHRRILSKCYTEADEASKKNS